MSGTKVEDRGSKINQGADIPRFSTLDSRSPGSFRNVLVALLLLLGVQLWLVASVDVRLRRGQPMLIAIAALLATFPPVARAIARLLDRIAHPSRRGAFGVSVLIFALSIAFLYFQATDQKRDFGLKYQDEYSYALQTRMIAHARLWVPAHPLSEFFQNFQVIATPVYGSAYFPGTALLNAPGIWLGWPHWVIPLLTAAACIAMIYRIFTELIDGVAGILGAILTASIPLFREQSIMLMAQIPALLGALILIWMWIRWRQTHGVGRAVLMGAIAGWLTITRPVDALVVVVPVGVGVLLDLRPIAPRRRAAIVIAGLLGAAPFLALQLVFNWRVTGSLTQTPFTFFTRQVYPQGNYGFHGTDPGVRPSWALPQVQEAYDNLANGYLRDHTPAKKLVLWRDQYLGDILRNIVPHPAFLLLIPVGLLGVRGRRWVVLPMFPLFVLLYFPYVFFIRHYTLYLIPAIFLPIVLGVSVLSNLSAKHRPQVLVFLVASIGMLSIAQWPQFHRAVEMPFISEPLRSIDAKLASLPHRPAIVLFRFTPGCSIDLEPAYNVETVWPDNAPVIRVHDLGEKNTALYRYYAQRQPDRWVYLYDRGSDTLSELGPVKTLANASP